jgi:peptidoglycan hydrolase CwlO-like protein
MTNEITQLKAEIKEISGKLNDKDYEIRQM